MDLDNGAVHPHVFFFFFFLACETRKQGGLMTKAAQSSCVDLNTLVGWRLERRQDLRPLHHGMLLQG